MEADVFGYAPNCRARADLAEPDSVLYHRRGARARLVDTLNGDTDPKLIKVSSSPNYT